MCQWFIGNVNVLFQWNVEKQRWMPNISCQNTLDVCNSTCEIQFQWHMLGAPLFWENMFVFECACELWENTFNNFLGSLANCLEESRANLGYRSIRVSMSIKGQSIVFRSWEKKSLFESGNEGMPAAGLVLGGGANSC